MRRTIRDSMVAMVALGVVLAMLLPPRLCHGQDQTPPGDAASGFLESVTGNKAIPASVEDGIALVDAANTTVDGLWGVLRSLFAWPNDRPMAGMVRSDDSQVSVLLNDWFREGTAAGNIGDLYDNRDRGHSTLPADAFPQLTRVAYSDAAIEAGVDQAMFTPVLFNAVTLGNASIAVTSPQAWRSLPRLMLTSPNGPRTLYFRYISNHIYVFPEHRDHDAELGDLLTANTPYYIVSQGSSGSDRPFLYAVASILAAFRPEVKAFLTEQGLIAPTVQWILRRGQRGVDSDSAYLTAKAHPSVFEMERLDLTAMVARAHDLDLDAVPPRVQIRVADESRGEPGVNWFGPDDETIFDTPSAVARAIRSTDYEKRLVIDAGGTVDPNGRPLTFHWSIIGGDERIAVKPLDDVGSRAEIVVPWQERRMLTDWPIITSDRVDIAVFAHNGVNWSAPAFVSLLYPGNQTRTYRSDLQIAEVDYAAPDLRERYVDPLVFPVQRWRDTYRYDDMGRLLGWERARGSTRTSFTKDGARVLETDHLGRPTRAEVVRYDVQAIGESREVIESPTGVIREYRYTSEADHLGHLVP